MWLPTRAHLENAFKNGFEHLGEAYNTINTNTGNLVIIRVRVSLQL